MIRDRAESGQPRELEGEPTATLSAEGRARREAMLASLLAAQSGVQRNRQARSLVLAACLAAAAIVPAVWFGGRVQRNNPMPTTAELLTPTGHATVIWRGVEIVTNAEAKIHIERVASGGSGIAGVRTADLLPSIRGMAMSDDELLAALRESGRPCALLRIAGGPAQLLCPDVPHRQGG